MYMRISYLSRERERPNRSDAVCDGAADGPTSRIERHVVHVAPRPILTGLKRPHDRVTGPAEVRGGVLVLRVVAAADVPARHAEPQVDPRIADPQAILTTVRAGRDFANLVPMRAFLCHTNVSVRLPAESRTIDGDGRRTRCPDHDLPGLGGRGGRDGHRSARSWSYAWLARDPGWVRCRLRCAGGRRRRGRARPKKRADPPAQA